MTHFAHVVNGKVINVIVAEQWFINLQENKEQWIQTSYNTHGGINNREGGTPLRKNYAGINYTYDKVKDAFIPPQNFPSWTLNENTCLWEPPIPYPSSTENIYKWNENLQIWEEK
jgi:hypothetical protein